MKNFFFNHKINFLFLFISLFCLAVTQGIDNISPLSIKWIHTANQFNRDPSLYQTAWYFFLNDIWRFPLGSNPNYGMEISSSIVISDTIPILSFFFKSLKSFIPENFQYFSFWFFVCFYFQLFFSFKILYKFTNSAPYSLIGSFFFLIAPIFLYRLQWHYALAGQWVLLFALYLGLTQNIDKAKWSWLFLIILSSLINVYYMTVIIAVYSLLRIFNLKFKKDSLFKIVKDFFIFTIPLLLTLYVTGYFEISPPDMLGMGYGVDKMNILSMFDSTAFNNSWSWFMPDIKLSKGEEMEGFNYLGLGQIMMMLLAFALFLNKNYETRLLPIKKNKEIKIFLIISLFLTFWALSNKIAFGSYTLVEIPLNKYVYGLLSILKGTGRIFYIVNYLLVIIFMLIIFKCFNKKNSLLIITLLFLIQIADTSAGIIKYRLKMLTPNVAEIQLKDPIWGDLFQKYKILKTTYAKNYTHLFWHFSYFMEIYNIEKTNVVALARSTRKASAETRYYIYDSLRKKKLEPDTVYLVNDPGHLKHLKYLLKDENVGFFIRDNIWAMVRSEKERMDNNDKELFKNIKPKLLEINKKKSLYYENRDNYYGFGWSHNFKKLGIWSEGPISTLFFRTDKNYGDLKLEVSCRPYITKKNNIMELDVYVNNVFNQSIKLAKKNQDEKIEILINKKLIKNNEVKIDFNFKNPVSPYEVLESPDGRKLGILLKNIEITSR